MNYDYLNLNPINHPDIPSLISDLLFSAQGNPLSSTRRFCVTPRLYGIQGGNGAIAPNSVAYLYEGNWSSTISLLHSALCTLHSSMMMLNAWSNPQALHPGWTISRGWIIVLASCSLRSLSAL